MPILTFAAPPLDEAPLEEVLLLLPQAARATAATDMAAATLITRRKGYSFWISVVAPGRHGSGRMARPVRRSAEPVTPRGASRRDSIPSPTVVSANSPSRCPNCYVTATWRFGPGPA